MEPISILQLEDSELDAQFNVACLERAGFVVESKRVQQRVEFEAALAGESFDLILADFKMPGFDGLEGLAIARQKAPNTRSLLFQASSAKKMRSIRCTMAQPITFSK